MTTIDGRAAARDLEMLRAGLYQAINQGMRAAVKDTEKAAKGTVLWKDQTTTTRGSIHGEWTPAGMGGEGFVEAGGAAMFLEYGTPRASPGSRIYGNPVLRFTINGQTLFRRSVKGMMPRPFMHEAREIGEHAALYYVESFIDYAIRAS